MTKQDTYQILGILRAIYPGSFVGSDDEERLRVTLWQKIFADESATEVRRAVESFVATDKKGFMPVPGQIKEQIAILRDGGGLNEQDAWELVTNALRNSSYGSAEEFAKLPTDIQRAVGSPNMLKSWASVNFNELQTVIASNFKREYRAIVAQKRDFAKIPEAVKQLADTSATGLIDGQ